MHGWKLTKWMLLILIFTTCESTGEEKTLVKLSELPSEMAENSGMTEYDGLLWNINDSGNEPALYGYNLLTDKIQRKVTLTGSVNTDWEEITQDENYLYVGDFGNNNGNRENLRIYRVNKSDLDKQTDSLSPSGLITFAYEDQTDFSSLPENTTSFDCEAFIALDDSLILFSKDWRYEKTTLYSLPKTPGNYIAKKIKVYNINGLVTAAAYSTAKQELLLLGYLNFVPFILVVPGFSRNNLSFDQSRRIDYGNFFGTQTEGIAFSSDGSVYVSCESSPIRKQTLFRAIF